MDFVPLNLPLTLEFSTFQFFPLKTLKRKNTGLNITKRLVLTVVVKVMEMKNVFKKRLKYFLKDKQISTYQYETLS